MAVKEITISTFKKEVEESNIPVLVKFGASWCKPCNVFGKILDEIKDSCKYKLKLCEVDMERDASLGNTLGVMSLPTVVFFKDGKEVGRFTGSISKFQLLKKIEENLKIKL